ncbi:aldolase, partial [Tilletiaria anomala UBC 951]
RTARTALDQAGFGHLPLIAGAGGHSVQLAIQSVHAAHAAGASHVLVLPSSYYPAQIGRPGAREFYTQLADSSPVPILIYSYPGVSAGIDLDSELVADLAHHPNIRGVKHTDHNIGKMARHCALPSAADADAASFFVLGGASDYYIGALAVGAHGTITGMGNIAPRAVVRLQQLWDQGKYEEARSLQGLVSVAEWELGKGGVPMHKALVVATRGYGGAPRRPLQPSAKAAVAQAERGFAALMQLERKLEREA